VNERLSATDPGPGEHGDQRVALFVDTQNLYYAARDAAGRNLDYELLLKIATRGRRLHAATAYVVEREGESTAYGFVTRLSALGYRVRRRAVRIHRGDGEGRLVLEGDWDMGIAADIVRAVGLQGRSFGETAARHAMSEGAVRVALHRALRRLSELRATMIE